MFFSFSSIIAIRDKSTLRNFYCLLNINDNRKSLSNIILYLNTMRKTWILIDFLHPTFIFHFLSIWLDLCWYAISLLLSKASSFSSAKRRINWEIESERKREKDSGCLMNKHKRRKKHRRLRNLISMLHWFIFVIFSWSLTLLIIIRKEWIKV